MNIQIFVSNLFLDCKKFTFLVFLNVKVVFLVLRQKWCYSSLYVLINVCFELLGIYSPIIVFVYYFFVYFLLARFTLILLLFLKLSNILYNNLNQEFDVEHWLGCIHVICIKPNCQSSFEIQLSASLVKFRNIEGYRVCESRIYLSKYLFLSFTVLFFVQAVAHRKTNDKNLLGEI